MLQQQLESWFTAVARLHGVDNLLSGQPEGALDVAEGCLHLLGGAAEGRGDLSDGLAVALNGLHQQLASRVTRELGGDCASASEAAESSEAASVPSEDGCDDCEVDDAPKAVIASEAVVTALRQQRSGEVGVETSAIGLVAVKNISGVHKK